MERTFARRMKGGEVRVAIKELKVVPGYEVSTWLGPRGIVEVRFSLLYHDWLKFEKSPEWQRAAKKFEALQKGQSR